LEGGQAEGWAVLNSVDGDYTVTSASQYLKRHWRASATEIKIIKNCKTIICLKTMIILKNRSFQNPSIDSSRLGHCTDDMGQTKSVSLIVQRWLMFGNQMFVPMFEKTS